MLQCASLDMRLCFDVGSAYGPGPAPASALCPVLFGSVCEAG